MKLLEAFLQLLDFITSKVFLAFGILAFAHHDVTNGILWLILAELWLLTSFLGRTLRPQISKNI